jgi:hypothetical protein
MKPKITHGSIVLGALALGLHCGKFEIIAQANGIRCKVYMESYMSEVDNVVFGSNGVFQSFSGLPQKDRPEDLVAAHVNQNCRANHL